eukprot:gene9647-16890_t
MLSLQNEGESISKLRTALLEAVKTGSAADTAKLLRRRRPPFAKELLETTFDGEGVPPLHIACKHGHLGVAKLLLNEGALVDVEDADPKRRATAIAYAAWGGNIPVIEHLIQHTKASLDERDVVGNTPLLYAIYGGHLSAVQALIKAGRSLREINHKAHSALLQAACGGHTALVEWLLDKGFNISDSDTDGNTALLFAAWGGFLDTMKVLLGRGASLEETNNNGHTVLLSAANGGRIEVVEWLLTQGFELTETNNNGDTCLLLAAYGGHRDLCKWLLDRGVSEKERNNCGFTPLLSAANGGQLDMVKWLLGRDSSLDEKDEDGYTPLILAACGGNIDMVQYFLSLGADVSERNQNGDTPLLLAAYCGHSKLVVWLLDNGASLWERNGTGMGALISAANGGNVEVVKQLLQWVAVEGSACGDSIENVDQGGYTPLLLAAQRGYPDVVQLLAMHGGNVHAKTLQHNNGVEELAHPDVADLVKKILKMSPLDIAADAGLVDHVHRLVPEATTAAVKHAEAVVQHILDKQEDAAAGAATAAAAAAALAQRVAGGEVAGGGGGGGVVANVADAGASSVTPAGGDAGGGGRGHRAKQDEDRLAIRRLLAMAAQPWAPCRHELFGMADRRTIWTLVLVTYRLANCEHLPHLPQEMWFVIVSFMGRSADHHAAAVAAVAAMSELPAAAAITDSMDADDNADAAAAVDCVFAAGQENNENGVGVDTELGSPPRAALLLTATAPAPANPTPQPPPTPSALSLLLMSQGSSEKSRSVWREKNLLRKVTAAKKNRRRSWASSDCEDASWLYTSGGTDDEHDGEIAIDGLLSNQLGKARHELFP